MGATLWNGRVIMFDRDGRMRTKPQAKSAETRFKNTQIQAKQLQSAGGPSAGEAVRSFKEQSRARHPARPVQPAPAPQVSNPAPPVGVVNPAPTGGPPPITPPVEAAPVEPPAVTSEKLVRPQTQSQNVNLEDLQLNTDLINTLRAPQVQNAVTRTNLQNYWKIRNNPNAANELDQSPDVFFQNVLGNMLGPIE